MNMKEFLGRLLGLAVALSVLVGCGGSVSTPLDESHWELVSLNGEGLIDDTRITLNFVNGFVRGSAGCNGYSPLVIEGAEDDYKYTASDDGALNIPGFMITEIGCQTPEGVMQQEAAYTDALRSAATWTAVYRLTGDGLEIDNAAGETILVFSSIP